MGWVWAQAHRGNQRPAQPWNVWAGLWGWGCAEARLEMAVCLQAGLLALTGALAFPTAAHSAQGPALLFPDCPSPPRCPGSTQYPLGSGHSPKAFICLQRGHLVLFMIVKHVAGGSDSLRPPSTAAEQITAWNLFWVRYFLSIVKGLN